MDDAIKQGARANNSGKTHENTVCGTLDVFAPYCTTNQSIAFEKIKNKESVLVKQPEFINVYGTAANRDFFMYLNDSLRIGIECKNQNTAGSVDEKIPFVLENFIHGKSEYNENIFILVLEGEHYKTQRGLGIFNYAREAAEKFNNSQTEKKIYITVGLTELEDLLLSLHQGDKSV